MIRKFSTPLVCGMLVAIPAFASVESSLLGLKSVLLGSILPIFAVLALGFAAFSFFTGNPNAKQHLVYAISGAVILFGAQSIVDLLQRVVQ
jgi:lipopolysaccharide export LptBFGC system permease protein LptF